MSLLSFCKGVRGGGERVERSEAEAMTTEGRSPEIAPEPCWRSPSEEGTSGAEEFAEENDGELDPAPKAMPRPVCPECGTHCHGHATSK